MTNQRLHQIKLKEEKKLSQTSRNQESIQTH